MAKKKTKPPSSQPKGVDLTEFWENAYPVASRYGGVRVTEMTNQCCDWLNSSDLENDIIDRARKNARKTLISEQLRYEHAGEPDDFEWSGPSAWASAFLDIEDAAHRASAENQQQAAVSLRRDAVVMALLEPGSLASKRYWLPKANKARSNLSDRARQRLIERAAMLFEADDKKKPKVTVRKAAEHVHKECGVSLRTAQKWIAEEFPDRIRTRSKRKNVQLR